MKTSAVIALCASAALFAFDGAGLAAPHRAVAGHGRAAEPAQPAARGPAPAPHAWPHWTYAGNSGPEHWGEMSEDFAACGKGHMQSPVDLGGAESAGRLAVRAA